MEVTQILKLKIS